ncbi:hypothetical protein [Streptomyces subrutilus]|uniref:Uncharacterized protein n=1 Tax=Streptomyces subrutilus TaxID=36818 RepID=A0A1E5NXY1_9ACTN|nr:hypothetical protein [Streptomyces subrutilus]OEJ21100.1 hypothetical protein BGK67_34995 [Streptomyces subrutilus]
MPFTVTGTFDDGAAYQVRVTGQADRPVIGSSRAAALFGLTRGRPIPLSPTGPVREVSPTDEETVLAVLQAYTRVLETGPGAPRRAVVPGEH